MQILDDASHIREGEDQRRTSFNRQCIDVIGIVSHDDDEVRRRLRGTFVLIEVTALCVADIGEVPHRRAIRRRRAPGLQLPG